jgi:hypothetical protein
MLAVSAGDRLFACKTTNTMPSTSTSTSVPFAAACRVSVGVVGGCAKVVVSIGGRFCRAKGAVDGDAVGPVATGDGGVQIADDRVIAKAAIET